MRGRGLYIHVPFCAGKCPYCDFYSIKPKDDLVEGYMKALPLAYEGFRGERIGSVYFGGGTPSLLGGERLCRILDGISRVFDLGKDAEISLEANPGEIEEDFFWEIRRAGFNRLSMGMQSADAGELSFLGRRHSAEDVERAVNAAQRAGLSNISLDLMLALPGQNWETLRASADFAISLGVRHISAYMLKIEEGTAFYRTGVKPLPDDDAAGLYLSLVRYLEKCGFGQYEISNFSVPGFESRHNLTYWRGEEYLGFGPAAHSFFNGKRFYYHADISAFIEGKPPIPDGDGGDFEEFAMLNLRLARGLVLSDCVERFGEEGEENFGRILKNCENCPQDLLGVESGRIYFKPEGFLVSNALLAELLS